MSSFSAIDHLHMAQALRLAERGAWTARPNPMVGCVLARGEQIVGSGWHRRAGEAHAEVHALREAGDAARGSTAYVTLEPCAHHGRTPPCADALVAAGVARVVCALTDPFHAVNGRGAQRLHEAAIVVEHGLMEAAARVQNRGFLSRIERGRPWLRVKLAMSLDGRTALASGESKWITGAAARADVQRWRARAGALLIGSGTLQADDPRLSPRVDGDCCAPLRVLLASNGVLSPTAALLREPGAVLVAHDATLSPQLPDVVEALPLARVDLQSTQSSSDDLSPAPLHTPEAGTGLDLHALMAALASRNINELQVEAGPTLSGALFAAGLVDELLLYQAPVLLGERGRPLLSGIEPAQMAERQGMRLLDARQVGADLRLLYAPVTP